MGNEPSYCRRRRPSPTQVVLDQRHLLGVSQFLDIVSKALFGFLAIYAGITSAREFEGNLILGGLLGAITIMPQVTTLGLIPGQGGLIGVIFAVWLMCLLEKQVRRFVPDIVDVVVTPTVVLLVMAAAQLFIIMPAAGVVSNGILHSLNGLLEHGGIAAGFVLSALFPFLISLGLHHGLFPIHLEMINATGHAPLFAIQIMSNAGMVGAATAVLLLTRDPVMKKSPRVRSQRRFWRWGTDDFRRQYSGGVCLHHGVDRRGVWRRDGGTAGGLHQRRRRGGAFGATADCRRQISAIHPGMAGGLCGGLCADVCGRQGPWLR